MRFTIAPLDIVTADGVRLEAVERRPAVPVAGRAVLCHAHPLLGGVMDHRFLAAVRRALLAQGWSVVSFNFRGVGASQGTFAGGVGELLDLEAVAATPRGETSPLVVCGWSFGARVALRATASGLGARALCLVAMPTGPPPVPDVVLPGMPQPTELARLPIPTVLVIGDLDELCPVEDQHALAAELADAEVHVVIGADHYFTGHEDEAAVAIADHLASGAVQGLARE